jgi:hypothetical protein
MFGYVCFYKGKRWECYAETALDAQRKAALHFRARRAYEVTVVLAEMPNGETVIHTPTD